MILADIGSSIMSAETAIELLEDSGQEVNAVIADAPLVEGSICAVVEAAGGGTVESVLKCAEESREALKLS